MKKVYEFEVVRMYTQKLYVEADSPELAVLYFEEGKAYSSDVAGETNEPKQTFIGYTCRNNNSATEELKWANYRFKGEKQ